MKKGMYTPGSPKRVSLLSTVNEVISILAAIESGRAFGTPEFTTQVKALANDISARVNKGEVNALKAGRASLEILEAKVIIEKEKLEDAMDVDSSAQNLGGGNCRVFEATPELMFYGALIKLEITIRATLRAINISKVPSEVSGPRFRTTAELQRIVTEIKEGDQIELSSASNEQRAKFAGVIPARPTGSKTRRRPNKARPVAEAPEGRSPATTQFVALTNVDAAYNNGKTQSLSHGRLRGFMGGQAGTDIDKETLSAVRMINFIEEMLLAYENERKEINWDQMAKLAKALLDASKDGSFNPMHDAYRLKKIDAAVTELSRQLYVPDESRGNFFKIPSHLVAQACLSTLASKLEEAPVSPSASLAKPVSKGFFDSIMAFLKR